MREREIKFRGKRKDNGEWVYGYYLCWNDKDWIYPGNRDASFPIGPEGVEVIPETVGQYTGLKDKNGVEIYHYDIIKRVMDMESTSDNCKKYDGAIGKVVYSLWPFSGFGIELIKGDEWSFYYPDGTNFSISELEVIGNIHEKELLNK